jgi:hypothetical protein
MYKLSAIFNALYNFIIPETKSAAQVENCKSDAPWAIESSSCETINNSPEVVVATEPIVKVVVDTKKPVIVFDIDDTICTDIPSGTDVVENAKLLNPGTQSGSWSRYTYLCLPYLDSLFNYLIDHKARIVFFSAGIKERNVALLEQILPQYLGEERYELLKAQGQFQIFSEDDLTPSNGENLGEGRHIKDLNKVINGVDQRNVILIDDDSSYVQAYQRPYIQPLDLSDWNVLSQRENGYNDFAKNGAYYLLGIFKEYFEQEQYSALQLKDGLIEVYKEREVSIFKKYHATSRNPFVREMIYSGLTEVQKTHEEAVLYGEYYFNEKPFLSHFFS